MQSLVAAGAELTAMQCQRIAVPKRFTLPMREIMQMQPRFERRKGKRRMALLGHRRFRAAYDLYELRHELGEVSGRRRELVDRIRRRVPERAVSRPLMSNSFRTGTSAATPQTPKRKTGENKRLNNLSYMNAREHWVPAYIGRGQQSG